MTDSTVDLPADPAIKQLAHDVTRDGNEPADALIRDFCRILEHLTSRSELPSNALSDENLESDIPVSAWREFFLRLSDDTDVAEDSRDFRFDAV